MKESRLRTSQSYSQNIIHRLDPLPLNDKQFVQWLRWLDKDRQREFAYARFSQRIDLFKEILILLVIVFIVIYAGIKFPSSLIYLVPSLITAIGAAFGIKRYMRPKNKSNV